MNIEEFREYCISKKGVTEELPFDEHTLVFKVMGKIFALTSLDAEQFSINLKCDPAIAIVLREEFDFILPGYHMNKKHWNTILVMVGVKDEFFKQYIDHSYNLVVKGLPLKQRELLHN
jgi:predicted DNA-binding protein (MmcQ/YjbR family)